MVVTQVLPLVIIIFFFNINLMLAGFAASGHVLDMHESMPRVFRNNQGPVS